MEKMMRAARMHAVGGPMSIDRIPVPEPGCTDVLVQVKACGMVPNLGNVLSNWTKWFPHLPLPKLPAIFGLDPTGVVVEVGSQVIGVRPGERVYVNPLRSCGACQMCRAGERSRCRYFTFNGYFGFGPDSQKIYDIYPYGGFCEYMTAPQYALVKLPDNVTFEQAARFGYTGTSYGAMKKANATPGQSMLVDGISGTLGLGAALLGLAMGITRIFGTGRNKALLRPRQGAGAGSHRNPRPRRRLDQRVDQVAHRRRRRGLHDQRARSGRAGKHHGGRLALGTPGRARGERRCRRRCVAARCALADGRADSPHRLELVHRGAGPGDGGARARGSPRHVGVRASPVPARSRSTRRFPALPSETADSATT